MIRFDCKHCGNSVRVADSFAGKKGRCPSCKQIVQIPAASQDAKAELDKVSALSAALDRHKEETVQEDQAPPPPPRQAKHDTEADLVVAGDPSNQTDRMEVITDADEFKLAGEDEPDLSASSRPATPPQPAPTNPPPAKLARRNRVMLIAIAGVAVAAVALALYVTIWQPWVVKPTFTRHTTNQPAGGNAAQATSPASRPAASAPVVIPPPPPPPPPVATTSAPVAIAPPPPPPVEPPKPAEKVFFLCVNKDLCATAKGGAPFQLDPAKENLTPEQLAGTQAVTCPTCKANTAAAAVQCPVCKKYYMKSWGACPNPECKK